MKKIVALMLVALMTMLLLTGCGKSGSAEPEKEQSSIDSIQTFGDILALEGGNAQRATYDGTEVIAFELDGKYYRAVAEIPDDVCQALWELDYFDERYEEKEKELIGEIKPDRIEDLTGQKLTQEEMDALAGKTGRELLEAGWYCNGYNLEDMEFWMGYGPFEYTVAFNEKVAEEDWDTFEEEDIADMTVKSVTFLALGNATDIEME